jgi:hypothetical protein
MELRRDSLKRVRMKMRSWKEVGLVLFVAMLVCSIWSIATRVARVDVDAAWRFSRRRKRWLKEGG